MAIQFSYITPATGAAAEYHVVQQIALDYVSQKTNATVASFVSKDVFDAGKQPVYQQTIQIDGLPTENADPKASVEADLIEAAPADGVSAMFPNRYLFAGATIVA
ncbi:TPA: hypothetical protein QDB05_000190 [Burkholderia vietnamiensis]|nr:hypothetical protein [Burkholderia vietnamiensis]